MKKHLTSVLIPVLALPAYAAEQSDTLSAIRSFLPPAGKAVAEPPAPAPAPAPEAPAADIPEPQPPPAEEPVLQYSADVERPTDVSPAAHAEAYMTFKERLDEQVKHNLDDYCPAISMVLSATNDEFATLAWMEKAAEEGHPAACRALAHMYAEGKGVEKNPEKAEKYMKMYKELCKKHCEKAKEKAPCNTDCTTPAPEPKN